MIFVSPLTLLIVVVLVPIADGFKRLVKCTTQTPCSSLFILHDQLSSTSHINSPKRIKSFMSDLQSLIVILDDANTQSKALTKYHTNSDSDHIIINPTDDLLFNTTLSKTESKSFSMNTFSSISSRLKDVALFQKLPDPSQSSHQLPFEEAHYDYIANYIETTRDIDATCSSSCLMVQAVNRLSDEYNSNGL